MGRRKKENPITTKKVTDTEFNGNSFDLFIDHISPLKELSPSDVKDKDEIKLLENILEAAEVGRKEAIKDPDAAEIHLHDRETGTDWVYLSSPLKRNSELQIQCPYCKHNILEESYDPVPCEHVVAWWDSDIDDIYFHNNDFVPFYNEHEKRYRLFDEAAYSRLANIYFHLSPDFLLEDIEIDFEFAIFILFIRDKELLTDNSFVKGCFDEMNEPLH